VALGATVRAYDPVASGTARQSLQASLGDKIQRVTIVSGEYEALSGADALCLCTEW